MKALLIAAAGAALAADASDAVDQTALVIARGVAAEQARDGRAMLAAARSLEALGARGTDLDLAAHWRARARARGIVDRLPPVRGRALGPGYSKGTLRPGDSLSTEQTFLAGQRAEVALVPQPGRALAMRIAGSDGQPICERTAQAPRASCGWLPVFTRRVQIRVTNRSTAPADYYLVSN